MDIVKTKNLKKYYGSGETMIRALDGIDMCVEKGKITAIVGASGSGKSTMLNLIGALDHPSEGDIVVQGRSIINMDRKQLTIFRRRYVGFVFQDHNLLPVLNGYDNITLPATFDKKNKIDHAFVEDLLNTLGMKDQASKMPAQMSGGQQQRIAIARAMVNRPALLLADEPTGNLDQKNSKEIIDLLKLSNRDLKQTILLITHDEKIALEADHLLILEDGKIISDQIRR